MRIRCRSEGARGLALGGLFVLALAGCREAREAPLPPVGAAKMELEQAACTARGGQWLAEGAARFCLDRTRDGGEACRTSADCEGKCLARSMTCSPVQPLVGCNEIVTSAGLRVSECVN